MPPCNIYSFIWAQWCFYKIFLAHLYFRWWLTHSVIVATSCTFSHTISSYLYYSPNIFRVIKSRRMRWAGHVVGMGERRGVYRVLVGKPEWKRPLGRSKLRWEDNIEMDLQEVGCGCMDRIELAEDRDRWRTLVNAVMNLPVP